MSRDLQLLGRAKRTHDGYLREVRKLACHYNTAPDQLSQQQVADYLLYLINDCQFAPGSLKVTYSALKMFYSITCPRDWDVLKKLRVPKQKTLPDVLTSEQVQQLIAATKRHHHAAFFWTLYTLGLRLQEGLNLQIGDIDSKRMTVHVHRGKGAKDRYLPLPESTLHVLRNYWKQHRNGEAALKYLAAYVNRVAISNNRIVAVDEQGVTFKYTPSRTRRSVKRHVTGNEFVRGFVQHTLPSRFQRLRYYGWASQNCELKVQWVQMLVWFYLGWCWLMKKQTPIEAPVKRDVRCKECGGQMQLVEVTDGAGRVIYQRPLASHALAYLDSG